MKEKQWVYMDVWEKPYVFCAFVGAHCVRIMNVVWDKQAEGLETRAGAVKIYPLVLFSYYVEINARVFFSGSNNKVTVIFRNSFTAAASFRDVLK